jgi:hypothetical protein
MNTIRPLSFALLLLVWSLGGPQYQGPIGNGHDRRRWADPPEQHNSTQVSNLPDPQELKKDADELAKLSQTIPADIEAINRGFVSSNLSERLKRIEKLSKKLRDAVQRSKP